MIRAISVLAAALCLLASIGCAGEAEQPPPDPPHGALQKLTIIRDGTKLGFGPFKGYWFVPANPRDLKRLLFSCYNVDGFYSSDAPENALLFTGEAVLTELPPDPAAVPDSGGRIRPVFFPEAPAGWPATRPAPQQRFRHFHSAYDATGAVFTGYWLSHNATRSFTYDMGGRVGPDSPLYHEVAPGPDLSFSRIVEFDFGPSE